MLSLRLWLYFELELPRARDKLAHENLRSVDSVLCQCNAGRINTVSVRHAGQRITLKTTSRQPSEKSPSLWMTP
ncbi:MAG: hypothetical protein R3C09_17945 [Pirellulaceae bacterium]